MKTKLYLFICLLLLQFTIAAQDFSAIDSFFLEKVEKQQLAGAVTLIAREGKILYFRSYGYMNIEQSIPMDKNAIIPIASMTKVMTTIACLILEKEEKLNIDDPVEKYLPAFRNLKVYVSHDSPETEEITVKPTIRHLLNHTAGFLYGGKEYDEAGFNEWNHSLSEFIDEITAIPLHFQPGTKWKYSYSHDILGYLIEAISGTTLDRFLKERLFLPLSMSDTDFFVPEEKSNRQSNLYEYKDDSLKQLDSKKYNRLPVALSGGGGWYDSYSGVVSSVSDFYLLADWILNYDRNLHPDILSPNSLRIMTSNQIGELMAFGSYKYGLGVGIMERNTDETKEVFWSGSPYNTYFWIDYEKREIGILFTNTAPSGHLGMTNKFRELAEGVDKKE